MPVFLTHVKFIGVTQELLCLLVPNVLADLVFDKPLTEANRDGQVAVSPLGKNSHRVFVADLQTAAA
jgi:hypothetical protein